MLSSMNLLPVGDGHTYIDRDKVLAEVHVPGAEYYKSEDGIWVRKESRRPTGQTVSEQEAFKAFMTAGRFAEAGRNFPKLFAEGAKVAVVIEQPVLPPARKKWSIFRFAAGAIVFILVAAYIGLIVTGTISASRQISVANLVVIVVGLIIVAIMIWPQALSNVQEFGVGGLSVKMREQLQEIQDTQKDHTKNLEEIHFILESLVTTSEMSHLRKLANRTAANYKRSPALLMELRRLRDVGLIEPKKDQSGNRHRIGHLPPTFDLGFYIDITERGNDYIKRIKDMEAPASTSAEPDGASG
jgi:hypothetical protein